MSFGLLRPLLLSSSALKVGEATLFAFAAAHRSSLANSERQWCRTMRQSLLTASRCSRRTIRWHLGLCVGLCTIIRSGSGKSSSTEGYTSMTHPLYTYCSWQNRHFHGKGKGNPSRSTQSNCRKFQKSRPICMEMACQYVGQSTTPPGLIETSLAGHSHVLSLLRLLFRVSFPNIICKWLK